MVTAEATMAVVRAARPVFISAHDGIAFAANAAFLADGYSLCTAGPAALMDRLPADEVEVGFEGWNSMYNCYAFLYSKEEEGKKKCILMECLRIADFLAINARDLEARHKKPCNVHINLFAELNGKDAAAAQNPNVESSSSINSSEYVLWENRSIRMIEPAGLIYPPVVPVGHDDTFPVPDVGFYPHSGGTGGSMHVGPNDPRFFPTNPSTPFGDLGSVPPGGRYDPIGPPDVPGFEPSRFVRHSRHSSPSGGSTHPDLEFFQQGPDFF
ncbi:hypothetical protein VPH35_102858 [Triticum aestivum]